MRLRPCGQISAYLDVIAWSRATRHNINMRTHSRICCVKCVRPGCRMLSCQRHIRTYTLRTMRSARSTADDNANTTRHTSPRSGRCSFVPCVLHGEPIIPFMNSRCALAQRHTIDWDDHPPKRKQCTTVCRAARAHNTYMSVCACVCFGNADRAHMRVCVCDVRNYDTHGSVVCLITGALTHTE